MSNRYRCLATRQFAFGDYALQPLQHEDIFAIKRWRNEQIDVLRQARPLTDADQQAYYDNVVLPLFTQERPAQLLFGFLLNGELIGYGGLVYLSWPDRRAEVSFLVDSERAAQPAVYARDFSGYLTLIKKLAFEALDFNRIFAETFDFRSQHVAILEQAGFIYEGTMKEHVRLNDRFGDSLLHGYLRSYYDAAR